ncbi:MAG: glucokinase [Hyphomicrobiales bacterium]|nr:glucokinase [Hyphomicrobiales bacterium]
MPPLPHPLLVADIGGTNCRVAIVDAPGDLPRTVGRLSTKAEPSCEAALLHAIAEAGAAPRSALLAVGGPVIGHRAALTNAGWSFDAPSLMAALGVENGLLLNDFEALATCLPVLGAADLTAICPGMPAEGVRLILGPGTGFGAAALVGREGRYTILPTEAGHIDLGPVTEDEFALWPLMERVNGRITVESVLSGSGLVRLDAALRRRAGASALCADGTMVSVRAEAGDAVALGAIRLFGRLLARVAGDLALAYKAVGGVFVAGGIAPKLLPRFAVAEMRRAFSHKPPMGVLMDAVPLWLVSGPDPAERGLAKVALDPAAFGLDNRLWV